MKYSIATMLLSSLILSGQLNGQERLRAIGSEARHLTGRHAITLSMGYLANSKGPSRIAVGGSTLELSTRAAGWIGYSYWFAEPWAVRVETGGMTATVNIASGFGGFSTETSTVVPLLLGIRYQPLLSQASGGVRPFVAALAGPYIEFSSRSGTAPLIWEGGTRSTMGVRFGGGVDVLAGRRFIISAGLRYHALGDFERSGDGRENYSGVEFAVGFGVLLGRR